MQPRRREPAQGMQRDGQSAVTADSGSAVDEGEQAQQSVTDELVPHHHHRHSPRDRSHETEETGRRLGGGGGGASFRFFRSLRVPTAGDSANVSLTILYNFLDGACYSVWGALLLPVLIGKVSGDAVVGTAAAAAGIAQLLAAGVAGYHGDSTKRQHFIRLGAMCGVLGVVVFLAAVWWSTAALDTHEDATGSASAASSSESSFSSSLSASQSSFSSSAAAVPSRVRVRRAVAALFILAQAVWGCYTGLVSTSSEALFADSVRSGERTVIYNYKWMVQTLCYLVGYLAALVLLLTLGNDWDVQSVRLVMSLGLLAHPVALCTLFMLRDSNALYGGAPGSEAVVAMVATREEEEDEDEDGNAAGGRGVATDREHRRGGEEETAAAAGGGAHAAQPSLASHSTNWRESNSDTFPRPIRGTGDTQAADKATTTAPREGRREANSHRRVHVAADTPATGAAGGTGKDEEEDDDEDGEGLTMLERIEQELAAQERRHHAACAGASSGGRVVRHVCFTLCSWRAVPYLVCLVDFLMALGSGMTLLYFPLFFKNDVGVSPVLLYATYITSTCLTAVTSHIARVAAERWLHRIPAVLLVRTAGSFFLLLIGVLPVNMPSGGGKLAVRRRPGAAALFLSLFICRNACMNAVMGMTRSVIMDAVKKESRAKWSAFESVSSFTWAGSAMVGGYIVERRGYQLNFTITAVFHLSAGLLLLPAAIGARRVERILKARE